MADKPGHLPWSSLVEVEEGIYLGKRAARAYRRVKVAFRQRGKNFTFVGKYAGYRSEEVQNGMANASRSPRGSKARAHYNISSASTIPISYSPNGSHQDGRAMDFLINGSSAYPNESDRALLSKFGWKFQFGNHDPNHVRHNNVQGIVPVSFKWMKQHKLFIGRVDLEKANKK